MRKINNLGQTVSQRRWTRQSTLCYYLGFNCSKCDLPNDIIKKCRMKATVLELVREFGKPPEKFLKLIEEELSGENITADDYIIDDESIE